MANTPYIRINRCFDDSSQSRKTCSSDRRAAAEQVTSQVSKLLDVLEGQHKRQELQERLGLSDRKHFQIAYLQPAIDEGYIEMTMPDKPKSNKQEYRLTKKGKGALR